MPFLWGVVFSYIPISMYIMFMEGIAGGGGTCGRTELLEIGNVIIIGFLVIALYEVINLIMVKRADGV